MTKDPQIGKNTEIDLRRDWSHMQINWLFYT